MAKGTRGGVLGDLLTVVVTLSAVAIAVVVVRREFFGGSTLQSAGLPSDRELSDWELVATGGHRIGPSSAPVTIVEFGDYQCPACRRFHSSLKGAMAAFPDQVGVIYRHLPLEDIHPVAYQAAKAAQCAADQSRFAPFHDLMYEQQSLLGGKSLSAIAVEAGIPDSIGFATCLQSNVKSPEIEADIQLARELGLRGTPTIAINGILYASPPDSLRLQGLIRDHLSTVADRAND